MRRWPRISASAERHADELTAGRLGDRLAERGLADAGRADEAQDRPLQLVRPALHRQVLDDAVLDLVETEVIGVEHFLSEIQVVLDLRLLAPRDRQQPVEVVAHHRRLGRHRAHLAQLLQLVGGLFTGLLRQLDARDALLELLELVLAVFRVAELLLNGLHLLVQVVLALRLLHLALDARADALLDLENRDLTLHQAKHPLQPLDDRRQRQDALLFGDLDRQVRGDGVGSLRVVLDLADGAHDLGRDLLVELHVVLELGHDRARERFRLDGIADDVRNAARVRLVVNVARGVAHDLGAADALHQHLHGAVGKLQQLQHRSEGADVEDGLRGRLVLARILLRGEQDLLVGAHHLFEGADRLLAADEERHDVVRKDDDVAQRQNRENVCPALRPAGRQLIGTRMLGH